LYPDLPAHRPPNFNEADVSDKPAWVQNTPQLTSTEVTELDRRRLGQLQMLHSLDLEINGLLDQLEAAGTLEDTVVMFLSDNGYLWGEHRMQEKWRPYDESVRIPFAIRYPSAYPQPRVEDRIVGNIDVAPTVWEVAGLPIPSEVDGQSLLPLLADDPGMDWRDDILLEGAEFSYNAVHTGDAVYIEYTADLPELYDLTLDPYQLDNQVNNPAYDGLESEMISRLDRLKPPDVRHQPELVSDQSYRIMRGAWRHVDDDNASAEGMRAASSTGQFIRLQTPAVRQLTVVFFKSWNQGIARIVIDGQVHGLVDLYSPIQKYGYRHHITGLTFAPHTISVEVTGQRNPASREAIVTVDAFVVAGTFVEETDPRLVYTTWWPWKHPEAAGGLYYRSRAANATVRFDPVGTNATLLTARGPEFGIAEIYLRGELIETVDLYSPVYEWQFPVPITGFRPGVTEHVVVKVTGRKNPASSDTLVIVDGFTQP
jgi:hypothetical protein